MFAIRMTIQMFFVKVMFMCLTYLTAGHDH
jgi:hypothetical protein